MRSSPPPTRIAGYRLGPVLRTTLNSFIYLGTNIKNREKYILKCIPLNSANISIDSIERECQIQTRLSHPYIMPIISLADDKDFRVITMNWAKEGSLRDIYGKNKVNNNMKNINSIAKIMYRLLSAVEYLHRNRVLHGDIKPANVVVSQATNCFSDDECADPIPHLIDFGFAHILEGSQTCNCTDLSPKYASPEQLLQQPHSFPSDIFSLGATFLYMITGKSPIKLAELKTMAQNFNHMRFSDISIGSLKELIQSMMSPNPKLRPTATDCLHFRFFEEILGLSWIEHERAFARPEVSLIIDNALAEIDQYGENL